MRENFDDRVKEWFPCENGNLIVQIEGDEGLDEYEKAKSVKTMPSHFGSFILSHSRRLMIEVIEQIGALYNNRIFYTDSDSLYTYKKYWSSLVDNGFVGKSLGLGKNAYGNSGIFYAWFFARKKTLFSN